MRASAAAALAALVLLAAPACEPSSLTPGFIDERGPEDYGKLEARNGVWEGVTSGGGLLRFQVASGSVADFLLQDEGPCQRVFTFTDKLPIEQGAFATTVELDSGGFFTVGASFTSLDAAVGSYSYSGASVVEDCPREGSGTFAAAPVR